MKNRFDEAIRFKNGNVNVKWFKENIEDCKAGKFSDIELLSYSLEAVDCYIIGEQFCLSNYAMGCLIYNAYMDCIYILNFNDLSILLEGKTLKLYANFNIDSDTRELIEGEC